MAMRKTFGSDVSNNWAETAKLKGGFNSFSGGPLHVFLQLLQPNKFDDSVYDDFMFMTWIEMKMTASDV